jgi:uncharacterized membrane-anchored protein
MSIEGATTGLPDPKNAGEWLKSKTFTSHPVRGRVLAEVHARPFVPMAGQRRILHFAFMTDHAAAEKDRHALEGFCLARACEAPPSGAKHHRIELSPAALRWEHHGEFTTYTWEFTEESPESGTEARPFRPAADELAGVMALIPQPGPLLVSMDLHLLSAKLVGDAYRNLFGPSELAASQVESASGVIATDFHPDAFGFVRLLVLDRQLTPAQAGALVQRLLEVETYRTLALLGLPEAQDIAPAIRRIETELPLLLLQMREGEGLVANRILLDRLTGLAAELEADAAKSLFRFGATRAYHDLMRLRLEAIDEKPLPDLPTLGSFLARRLTPAIRTCASIEARQDNLSRKLARAAQLLRTRVEIDLESQNSDLLRKMNDRARLQLRLQQTVEGLSVAAISYYISSILHLVFEGIHSRTDAIEPEPATALAVPFIVVFVAWTVRRIRKQHKDE